MNVAAALLRTAAAGLLAVALHGCAPAPTTASIAELYQHPPERALIDGIRLYDRGEFAQAEALFRQALSTQLADPRDVATANKYLAFIACAFNRETECALDFTNAFNAYPDFRLSDAEIGHPLWGPVYRRVAQALGHPDNRGASAGAGVGGSH